MYSLIFGALLAAGGLLALALAWWQHRETVQVRAESDEILDQALAAIATLEAGTDARVTHVAEIPMESPDAHEMLALIGRLDECECADCDEQHRINHAARGDR